MSKIAPSRHRLQHRKLYQVCRGWKLDSRAGAGSSFFGGEGKAGEGGRGNQREGHAGMRVLGGGCVLTQSHPYTCKAIDLDTNLTATAMRRPDLTIRGAKHAKNVRGSGFMWESQDARSLCLSETESTT